MKKLALLFAFAVFGTATLHGQEMNARAYYRELHDSGAEWNVGHRFNLVCFGEGETDLFVTTRSFVLVGFSGNSPRTIEIQEYTKGAPERVSILERNSDGSQWIFERNDVRVVFALSKTNRYKWEIDFPDSSQPNNEGHAVSHGKCEVIQDLHVMPTLAEVQRIQHTHALALQNMEGLRKGRDFSLRSNMTPIGFEDDWRNERGIHCSGNSGAKYIDLDGAEQTCQ